MYLFLSKVTTNLMVMCFDALQYYSKGFMCCCVYVYELCRAKVKVRQKREPAKKRGMDTKSCFDVSKQQSRFVVGWYSFFLFFPGKRSSFNMANYYATKSVLWWCINLYVVTIYVAYLVGDCIVFLSFCAYPVSRCKDNEWINGGLTVYFSRFL